MTTAADPTEAGMAARRSRIPLPPAAPDVAAQIDGLVTSLEGLNSRVAAAEFRINILSDAEMKPAQPQPPVFTPPTYKPSLAAMLPVILAVALIFVQQTLIVLRTLPPSTPVTIALAVLTVLAASIPLIEQQLQMQNALGLHELAVETHRAYIWAQSKEGSS